MLFALVGKVVIDQNHNASSHFSAQHVCNGLAERVCCKHCDDEYNFNEDLNLKFRFEFLMKWAP